QGQERQDELGLNWDSFKWRNYDYAIARFMSVDPLAEEYSYQSVYQFASNQPVHAQEIEGLENAFDLNTRFTENVTAEEKQAFNEGVKGGISTVVDFIPGIGDVKGFIEGLTGNDLV